MVMLSPVLVCVIDQMFPETGCREGQILEVDARAEYAGCRCRPYPKWCRSRARKCRCRRREPELMRVVALAAIDDVVDAAAARDASDGVVARRADRLDLVRCQVEVLESLNWMVLDRIALRKTGRRCRSAPARQP